MLALTPDNGSITVGLSVTINGPTSGLEGSLLTYTATTLGQSGTLVYLWSTTKDGLPYAMGNQATYNFTPDDDGSYVTTLRVTDEASNTGTGTTTTAIANVAPGPTPARTRRPTLTRP